MALAFTEAGLQTELDALATAVDGGDVISMRKQLARAEAVMAALPHMVTAPSATGGGVTYQQQLSGLRAAVEAVASAPRSDQRRMIRTSVSHG